MNILCLEQGDWMDPAQYPTTGMDWELRRFGDFGLSPNTRGRPEDYPVNDAGSPIAISTFNAVGGSTILYAGHFPRLHPSDFRVRTLDGVVRRPATLKAVGLREVVVAVATAVLCVVAALAS